MGLFSNKKERIEEPIELPDLPDLPENEARLDYSDDRFKLQKPEDLEINELPFLPDSESKEKLSQIKQAINEPENIYEPDRNMVKSKFTPIFSSRDEREYSKFRDFKNEKIEIPKSQERNEPVFIRLDKFESTALFLEEIKNKLNKIEGLLEKTKEIQRQEEKELEEWEREMSIIKTKIDSIDKNLFKKFD